MYLLNGLVERGRDVQVARPVRRAGSPADGAAIVSDAVSPLMATVLEPSDLERVRKAILALPELPPRPGLNAQDWLGAAAVFLLVFLSTFPVVLPFLVFDRLHTAMRVSDWIAMGMLFAAGFLLARHGGYHPWRTGFSMVLLGMALVAIAVALGG
jgi:VIT1/CCC1 family predicted Fe2+/Mn2+ transporter